MSMPSLAVIGGGIFGLTAALEAARLKMAVSVFERSANALQGASKINTGVVHLGYHYPRSMETVLQSQRGSAPFTERFSDCILSDFPKYYCVASEASLTSAEAYLAFCEQRHLPYRLEYPPDPFLDRERVRLSIRVSEGIFDYRALRARLLEELNRYRHVSLLTQHEVVGAAVLNHGDRRKRLQVLSNGSVTEQEFDCVLNASYANTNFVNSLFGAEPLNLQYEVSEFVVLSIPWQDGPLAVTVMDGPFCTINPFGFTGLYSLGHVETTIRKRSIGHTPSFDCQEAPLNLCRMESNRRLLGDCNLCHAKPSTIFPEMVRKSQVFFPILSQARHERSYFVMRCVLAHHEFDDARPTLVLNVGPGIWSILGGKLDTSLDAAQEFRASLEAHLASAI
jgi:hypothetical protein